LALAARAVTPTSARSRFSANAATIVADASMGALVGGVFAAGKLDEFGEWALGLSQHDVLRLVDVRLTAPV
jgi:predicted acylesterase/phospholipase RssA